MSFFDDASLAFLPSGAAGKDGKAYSIKPTDGTGDFTFSRGSNLAATRVGADGLIEKGRENLLTYSNTFSHSSWMKSNISVTSGQTGYDGNNDAWLYTINGPTHHFLQNVSSSSINVFSVYAKAGTADGIVLRLVGAPSNPYIFWNLLDGSYAGSGGGGGINGSSQQVLNVGNGWYRIQITAIGATQVIIYGGTSSGGFATSGNILIQDAQLEIGLAATDYIETGATTGKAGLLEDEPRFDYSGGATCPSLLLEPSRTQLLPYSEYFGAWTILSQGTGSVPSVSIGGDFPLGDGKYYNLQCDLNGGTTSSDRSYISLGGLSGTQFTAAKSLWIKNNLPSEVTLFAGINFSSDEFTLAANEDWQRITIEGGVINTEFRIGLGGGASNSDVIDVSIYGAQLEEGSYATSYIPNHSGGSVTRGADDCGDAGDAATFNSTEGVLYAEIAALADDLTFRGVSLSDGTYNNRCVLRYGGASNRINVLVSSAGSIVFDNNFILSNIKDFSKIAIKWKANDFALWVNGSEVATDTSGASPTGLSQFQFADSINSSVFFYGKTNQVLYFPTALSDADLATLTTL